MSGPSTAIRFRCPHCGKRAKVHSRFAGRRGSCPGCSNRIRIPAREKPAVIFLRLAPRESQQAGCHLLLVEGESLRVLVWKRSDTTDDVQALGSVQLVERVAAVARKDQRIPFDRILRVSLAYHGGLAVDLGEEDPLLIPLETKDAESAFALLGTRLKGFAAGEEEVRLAEAIALPCVLAVATVIAGTILYAVASSAGSGSVRTGGLKGGGVIMSLVGAVGPGGVLLLVSVLVGGCGWTIFSRVSTPPKVPVLVRET